MIRIELELEMNLTSFTACITMNGECSLPDSLYMQYMEIKKEYNETKQYIQNQFTYSISWIAISSFINRVQRYQITVQGVIADVQALYLRIQQVQSALDFYGIDIGFLPSLYLPTLSFPSLGIQWDLPGMCDDR